MAQQWPYKGFKGHYEAMLRRLVEAIVTAKTLDEVVLGRAKLEALDVVESSAIADPSR